MTGPWDSWIGTIQTGDCLKAMAEMPDACVDMTFIDPPYNLDRPYDSYDDKREAKDYLAWCEAWLKEIYRITKPNGSFWLLIGQKYVSELDVTAKAIGFHQRRHGLWYFTFGLNETRNFTNSHTHWILYAKDQKNFTFNDMAIRVPSARQRIYKDPRASSKGRIPDDTWILRPQEVPGGMLPDHDVFYEPRVCGTYKAKRKTDNQLPEAVVERAILTTSNPDDLTFDPMSGSGTLAVVAERLGRRHLSIELSPAYAAEANARLSAARSAAATPA